MTIPLLHTLPLKTSFHTCTSFFSTPLLPLHHHPPFTITSSPSPPPSPSPPLYRHLHLPLHHHLPFTITSSPSPPLHHLPFTISLHHLPSPSPLHHHLPLHPFTNKPVISLLSCTYRSSLTRFS